MHSDGPLVLNDYYFGEPSDLVAILNAYRSVYRSTESFDTSLGDAHADVGEGRKPLVRRPHRK